LGRKRRTSKSALGARDDSVASDRSVTRWIGKASKYVPGGDSYSMITSSGSPSRVGSGSSGSRPKIARNSASTSSVSGAPRR
jgi:hypothetical protein